MAVKSRELLLSSMAAALTVSQLASIDVASAQTTRAPTKTRFQFSPHGVYGGSGFIGPQKAAGAALIRARSAQHSPRRACHQGGRATGHAVYEKTSSISACGNP